MFYDWMDCVVSVLGTTKGSSETVLTLGNQVVSYRAEVEGLVPAMPAEYFQTLFPEPPPLNSAVIGYAVERALLISVNLSAIEGVLLISVNMAATEGALLISVNMAAIEGALLISVNLPLKGHSLSL